ncbi:hypothetical protein M0811_12734 [Anaeramoeba ignava]|uniref:Uncharacterized protein n=1 Tax=Anaeramoeba ignava TaxID=1746090 RepID=A0A9Q0L7T0_ANAIG|nr:hypothetical protein M0811_12734 [Anaeramoeba ignava]
MQHRFRFERIFSTPKHLLKDKYQKSNLSFSQENLDFETEGESLQLLQEILEEQKKKQEELKLKLKKKQEEIQQNSFQFKKNQKKTLNCFDFTSLSHKMSNEFRKNTKKFLFSYSIYR